MTTQELKQLITAYQDLENLAWKRGKEALLATKTGFGKCTGHERIEFEEDHIEVICYDKCYSGHDVFHYRMSFEELLMSDEEWEKNLIEVKRLALLNKKIKAEEERKKKLKDLRKEFERLKKELEG